MQDTSPGRLAQLRFDHEGNPLPRWLVPLLWIAAAELALFVLVNLVLGALSWVPDLPVDVDWFYFLPALIFAGAALWTWQRRRRVTVELLGWMFLIVLVPILVSAGDHHLESLLQAIVVGFAPIVLLVARNRLFSREPRAESRWRDFRQAVRLTLALALIAECVAAFLIGTRYRFLRASTVDPIPKARAARYVAGRTTFATLGSSPATVEREHGRSFSSVLAARFDHRYNFLYYTRGGLNSDMVLRIAKRQVRGRRRPDAFILYMGHQDFNQRKALKLFRELDVFARSGAARNLVRLGVLRSHLIRLSLYLLQKKKYQAISLDAEVLVDYQRNIERIIALASRAGIHVFVVTLVLDRSRVSKEALHYVAQVNQFLRKLPTRFANVTLVDFQPVFWKRFPKGRGARCQPFEPVPRSDRCGDPFHLGVQGHALLSEVLAPVLDTWAKTRRQR